MPAYFDIRIPVITLRVILIFLTTATVSLSVLFPFSCLAFNFFYNYLIPTPTISLRLSDFVVNYDFPKQAPFVVFSEGYKSIYGNHPRQQQDATLFSALDPDLHYDVELKFDPHCRQKVDMKEAIMYKTTIMSDALLAHLSPYGLSHRYSKRNYGTWPITNNIHMLDNTRVLISSLSSFILECTRESLTIEKLFPPVFQWFLPPVIAEYDYFDGMHTLPLFTDIRLNDYLREDEHAFTFEEPWSVVLEFNKNNLVFEPVDAVLAISVSWKGLRYYLYHYRSLSYLLGVGMLWSASTLALFATIGSLIMVREISGSEDEFETLEDDDIDGEEEADKQDTKDTTETPAEDTSVRTMTPIKPGRLDESFTSGRLTGTSGDMDFTLSVKEQ